MEKLKSILFLSIFIFGYVGFAMNSPTRTRTQNNSRLMNMKKNTDIITGAPISHDLSEPGKKKHYIDNVLKPALKNSEDILPHELLQQIKIWGSPIKVYTQAYLGANHRFEFKNCVSCEIIVSGIREKAQIESIKNEFGIDIPVPQKAPLIPGEFSDIRDLTKKDLEVWNEAIKEAPKDLKETEFWKMIISIPENKMKVSSQIVAGENFEFELEECEYCPIYEVSICKVYKGSTLSKTGSIVINKVTRNGELRYGNRE